MHLKLRMYLCHIRFNPTTTPASSITMGITTNRPLAMGWWVGLSVVRCPCVAIVYTIRVSG